MSPAQWRLQGQGPGQQRVHQCAGQQRQQAAPGRLPLQRVCQPAQLGLPARQLQELFPVQVKTRESEQNYIYIQVKVIRDYEEQVN